MLMGFFALFALASLGVRQLYRMAYPQGYKEQVEMFAACNGLPAELVYAVIRTESGFRPLAVSEDEARGLMQITEPAFDWARERMGDKVTVYGDLFDPEANIRYGTYILALLTEEFKDTSTVLCAYHAGWGSVKRWLEDPAYSDGATVHTIPYSDTRWYVSEVNRAMDVYRRLYKR
jgi:soluble lytic murein transglycosylase